MRAPCEQSKEKNKIQKRIVEVCCPRAHMENTTNRCDFGARGGKGLRGGGVFAMNGTQTGLIGFEWV